MSRVDLFTPHLNQGLRHSNFFNGRVLTAEVLSEEQLANHLHDRRLGQAIGEGVVHGLEVRAKNTSKAQASVTVSAGMALNRRGQVLNVPSEVEVFLGPAQSPLPPTETGFHDCQQAVPTLATDLGVYLLTLCPSEDFQQRAPRVSLGDEGVVRGCGSRYLVEGVQFRLMELDLARNDINDGLIAEIEEQIESGDDLILLRNLLAHACYGTLELAFFVHSNPFNLGPFGEAISYGALDELRPDPLTDCDVPLGLIYFSSEGLKFVDQWSVRRRVTSPLVSADWPFHVDRRRLAEAEAMFLQFQETVATIPPENLPQIRAAQSFRFLPAAGFWPRPFPPTEFFTGIEISAFTVHPAVLRSIVHESFYLGPIDLQAVPPIAIYDPGDFPYYVFSRRDNVEVLVPTEPEPPPSPPETATGRILVTLRLKSGDTSFDAFTSIAGTYYTYDDVVYAPQSYSTSKGVKDKVTTGRRSALNPSFEDSFTAGKTRTHVWADDTITHLRHYGVQVRTATGTVRPIDKYVYEIRSLPPSTYRVSFRAPGFLPNSRQVELDSGETLHVTFNLIGDKIEIPDDLVIDAVPLEPSWFDEMIIIDDLFVQPPEIPPDYTVDPPPPEIYDQLAKLSEQYQAQYADLPFDPGDITFHLNPQYDPEVIPDEPYAYVRFGQNGATAPVVLTPRDRTLKKRVGLEKGNLTGLDFSKQQSLASRGLGDLDVFAAAWSGLIADSLGISQTAGRLYLSDAQTSVDNLQGSLEMLTGVGNVILESELSELNIADLVDLANADAQQLADAQSPENRLSVGYWQLLIDEARSVVPNDAWSLESKGLNQEQIQILNNANVYTLKALSDSIQDDGSSDLPVELGIGGTDLIVIRDSINARIGEGGTAHIEVTSGHLASAPVTRTTGINVTIASALVQLGVLSVGDLANADAAKLSNAFGGDLTAATDAIKAAGSFLGEGLR